MIENEAKSRAASYFLHERRHKTVLWDSCRIAACHYTWWIYKSAIETTRICSAVVPAFNSDRNKPKRSNLRVELLLRSSMAVLTSLRSLTFTGISPLLALFHRWTWQRPVKATTIRPCLQYSRKQLKMMQFLNSGEEQSPVFVLVRAAPPVFAVVVIRTGVSLATQAGRLFTELRLVMGQHIIVI